MDLPPRRARSTLPLRAAKPRAQFRGRAAIRAVCLRDSGKTTEMQLGWSLVPLFPPATCGGCLHGRNNRGLSENRPVRWSPSTYSDMWYQSGCSTVNRSWSSTLSGRRPGEPCREAANRSISSTKSTERDLRKRPNPPSSRRQTRGKPSQYLWCPQLS